MTGEIVTFRKKFIGGFNRDDVAAYIAKITKERNDNIYAREKIERDIAALKNEMSAEKGKLDEETRVLLHDLKIEKENAEREAETLRIRQLEMQTELDMKQAELRELQARLEEQQDTSPPSEQQDIPPPFAPFAEEPQDSPPPQESPPPQDSPPPPNKLVVKLRKKD